MNLITLTLILIALFIIENFYFKIADRFNIIDKPNHRSSHTSVTIRGGGIIFSIAAFIFFILYQLEYPWFMAGLFLISLISFLDDLITLNNKTRLVVHLISVALIFTEWHLWEFHWGILLIAFIFVIGTINAYNFMDGINGITGAYSLATLISLYFIDSYIIEFIYPELLLSVGLGLCVFNFYNFRYKAKCFAGDVGSISIAFILVFCIGMLIIKTSNFTYLLLLLVYGLDAVVTITFRLFRRENIFEAHRSHFYQYLSNERKFPHIYVAVIYSVTQIIINVILLFFIKDSLIFMFFFVVVSASLFIALRLRTEGSAKLLK